MAVSPPNRAQTLARGLAVLETLRGAGTALSLTELAGRLGLAPSVVHRLLATLVDCGLVEQVPLTRRYRLGLGLFTLGMAVIQGRSLYSEAVPRLEALSEQTGFRAHLALLDGLEIVYLHTTPGRRSAPPPQPPGWRAPAWCTALGKVLLAHLPPARRESLLGSAALIPATEFSITSIDGLRADLDGIRQRGYGLDLEESQLGCCCVAGPVRDASGEVMAAISLGWISRAELAAQLGDLVRCLTTVAAEISLHVGYLPPPAALAAPSGASKEVIGVPN